MNREIKFRIWSLEAKEMFEDFPLVKEDKYLNDVLADENYIFMQYTGLKDKNGKEIYEGDIIKYKYNDELSPVTYGHTTCECCGWCYGFSTENEKNRFDDPNDCEVVGNIYENPELIK